MDLWTRGKKSPKVTKSVSTFGAKLLKVIPIKQNKDPRKVTFLQLNFWHNALANGAIANARVVILAGIQDANATEELGNVFKIKSKITPYDLTMPKKIGRYILSLNFYSTATFEWSQ